MGRKSWELIKQNKTFNVNVYRRGLSALIVSLIINCILGLSLFYIYQGEPQPDYYATSGVTAPIKLQALLAPNNSSNALLPPDPIEVVGEKLIPE